MKSSARNLTGTAFLQIRPADMNVRWQKASLRERKSARSACTTQKVMWSALRRSSGKARMMMSSRPTRWMIFSKECLRGKETVWKSTRTPARYSLMRFRLWKQRTRHMRTISTWRRHSCCRTHWVTGGWLRKCWHIRMIATGGGL